MAAVAEAVAMAAVMAVAENNAPSAAANVVVAMEARTLAERQAEMAVAVATSVATSPKKPAQKQLAAKIAAVARKHEPNRRLPKAVANRVRMAAGACAPSVSRAALPRPKAQAMRPHRFAPSSTRCQVAMPRTLQPVKHKQSARGAVATAAAGAVDVTVTRAAPAKPLKAHRPRPCNRVRSASNP